MSDFSWLLTGDFLCLTQCQVMPWDGWEVRKVLHWMNGRWCWLPAWCSDGPVGSGFGSCLCSSPLPPYWLSIDCFMGTPLPIGTWAREASRVVLASATERVLWEGKGAIIPAFGSACFVIDCLHCEQTGAVSHSASAGSITVISKDTNVSDKSHWKENSSRLTINWSDYLILVSFRRKMQGWSEAAIFIHINLGENGECEESWRQGTKTSALWRPKK